MRPEMRPERRATSCARVAVALAAAGPALAGGCTFQPGEWFGTLTPTLGAAFVARADRDAGQGWQRLSNDYQMKVARAELELGELALMAVSAGGRGGGGGTFDPARPPPGYTLCHNGHCHSTEGRLVPYAEIQAMLSGGGGGTTSQPVVTLAGSGRFDLLMPMERPLVCKPGCGLGRVHILRASAPVVALTIEASVRDGRSPPRITGEIPFRFELPAAPGVGPAPPPVLEAELDLPIDHDQAPEVHLRLQVELTAALLDGLELAGLAPGDPAAGERILAGILANLGEGKFMTATVTRRD